MVEQASVFTVGSNRAINESIHLGDAIEDFGADLSGRHAFWRGGLRSLAAFRQISTADNNHALKAIFDGCRASKRLARRQTTLKTPNGSSVGEIEMLEDFGGAPFAKRATG